MPHADSQVIRPESRARRAFDLTLVLAFLAASFAPLIDARLRPNSSDAVLREQRRPAPEPLWSWRTEALQNFPARYEAWYRDTFGLRDRFVRWHNALCYFGFKTSPAPIVFVGRDGWIFYTGEQSREAWRGTLQKNEYKLLAWKRLLERRRDHLAALGIGYLFVIVPNKDTLYPEQLPASEAPVGPTPREIFFPWMAAHSDVPLLDLSVALKAERAFDRPEEADYIFHPLGAHWTDRGAWSAVQAIVTALVPRFPVLHPSPRDGRVRRFEPDDQGDSWAKHFSIDDILKERVYSFRPVTESGVHEITPFTQGADSHNVYENPDGELPSILLMHDSFGPSMWVALAEHTKQLSAHWTDHVPDEEIASRRPAVVIEMYTERCLVHRPPVAVLPVLTIEPALFEQLERARPDLDEAGILRELQPVDGTHIERASDGHSIAIDALPGRASVFLSAVSVPADARLALRCEVDAPAAGLFTIWYMTHGETDYRHEEQVELALHEGSNSFCVRLPVDGIEGRLLVSLGPASGRYVLRNLDLRW